MFANSPVAALGQEFGPMQFGIIVEVVIEVIVATARRADLCGVFNQRKHEGVFSEPVSTAGQHAPLSA